MIYLQDPDLTIYQGDVSEVLQGMPDGSVDCVVTSPPYWGLRDYGTDPVVFGGDPACRHEWDTHERRLNNRHAHAMREGLDTGDGIGGLGKEKNDGNPADWNVRSGFCECGAWRGNLGLEPTPELFVKHLVDVFREVRRVLADHGTCWVNLGDSYASQGGERTYGSSDNGTGRAEAPGPRIGAAGVKPKDLVGIPWRVAFALQADGWYLRSDIVWSKANPMPESVTDRPTKSHEYVFLLSKQARYFFDQEAVREAAQNRPIPLPEDKTIRPYKGPNINNAYAPGASGYGHHPNGRNIRSVWDIATQAFPEAHFATFPEELVRRCLLAGCPEWVCRVCGEARKRLTENHAATPQRVGGEANWHKEQYGRAGGFYDARRETVGFTDCGHNDYRPGVVLDIFGGSGTTALVARKHARRAVLIELNPDYCQMAARRLSQQSLFAEAL